MEIGSGLAKNMKNYFKNCEREPWQISAARYCVTHSEEGFTKDGLIKYIKSSYKVSEPHLQQFWDEEIYKPAGRKFSRSYISTEKGGVWIPPIDLVSKITDYDELKEARKNAKQAFWLSMFAIIISTITLWFTIRQTNYTELQSIPDRIFQNRAITEAKKRCKESPDLQDSGLYDIETGESAPCPTVLKIYKD